MVPSAVLKSQNQPLVRSEHQTRAHIPNAHHPIRSSHDGPDYLAPISWDVSKLIWRKAKMNKRSQDVLFLISAFLILVFSVPSVGQVLKGSISGTVVDPQNAVLVGATRKPRRGGTAARQREETTIGALNATLFERVAVAASGRNSEAAPH